MENNIESAQHTMVRNKDGKPEYVKLDSPATVVYNSLLFVIKHTPVLENVPGICPESFFNKEMEGGANGYFKFCNDFYKEIERNNASISWNVGDIVPFETARITDEWVDAKVDSAWRYVRAPRANVVMLCPNPIIEHDNKQLSSYEFWAPRKAV